MKIYTRLKEMTAEEHRQFEERMFKTERLQTLVARHRAGIRKTIVQEQEKAHRDASWIAYLEKESLRILALRNTDPENLDAVLEELKNYQIPTPIAA